MKYRFTNDISHHSYLENIVTVAFNMRFRFYLKNGKIHEFTLPEGIEVHRAIVWTSKKDKKKMTRIIIIPDEVESVESFEAETV